MPRTERQSGPGGPGRGSGAGPGRGSGSSPRLEDYLLRELRPDELDALLEEFREDWQPQKGEITGEPLPGAALHWEHWVKSTFPHVCRAPFQERHRRLWEWFEALKLDYRPRPRVEVWPRGGGKSSTLELAVTRCCVRLCRRYALIFSGTQEQANKHVQAIASLMERAGIERALNVYGHSKGWRRQELRTANGFNVSAYGLDVAIRGVKLDEFRPDLILYDDLDSQDDSARTIEKKIATLTTAILPAESADCAHVFVQNLIRDDGIFGQLLDGTADFLHDREPAFIEPAVRGLKYESVDRGDGQRAYRITAGEATWEGQSLEVAERQLNIWGLTAFLREAQHEVSGAGGYVFDVSQLGVVAPEEVPELVDLCLAWDLAATEGGGDWTVGVLLGRAHNDTYYVLAVIRGQWSAERVRAALKLTTAYYEGLDAPPGLPVGPGREERRGRQTRWPKLKRHVPQDPGQAGKDQAEQLRKADRELQSESVSGKKATRATGFAEQVNLGNVFLVSADLPPFLAEVSEETGRKPLRENLAWQAWHRELRDVLRKFRENETDQLDDDVDACADAYNVLARKRKHGFH